MLSTLCLEAVESPYILKHVKRIKVHTGGGIKCIVILEQTQHNGPFSQFGYVTDFRQSCRYCTDRKQASMLAAAS